LFKNNIRLSEKSVTVAELLSIFDLIFNKSGSDRDSVQFPVSDKINQYFDSNK